MTRSIHPCEFSLFYDREDVEHIRETLYLNFTRVVFSIMSCFQSSNKLNPKVSRILVAKKFMSNGDLDGDKRVGFAILTFFCSFIAPFLSSGKSSL
mmetsp:Transcript_55460/g.66718  ORF Transcript_55460/g.66718 Transcript_55460/m.66718 type:complete len:96 (-) Transcript_55460:894-1181(-)